MSKIYDIQGYARSWVPGHARDDEHYEPRTARTREQELLEKVMSERALDEAPIPEVAMLSEKLNPYAAVDETESPIERLMHLALMFRAPLRVNGFDPVTLLAGSQFIMDCPAVQIIPQYRIGVFRADLAVGLFHSGMKARLIVECDGHAFHSGTREQASRDRRRDRDLLGAGWSTIRFTGSEINAGPIACAQDVAFALNGLRHDSIASFDHGRKFERNNTDV